MCSTSEDVQYESVQARMCSTNDHIFITRGCTVRARHIFGTNEDVQYELGTSSVHARYAVRARHIFSTSEDVQYK